MKGMQLPGKFFANRPCTPILCVINLMIACRAGSAHQVRGQPCRGCLQGLLRVPARYKRRYLSLFALQIFVGNDSRHLALLAIYKREATAEAQAAFFANSKAHWGAVRSALFEVYPALLPASGFIGGAEPGEDDFHMIAWITRIAWVSGARSGEEGLSAFNTAYGEPAPDTVAAYWRAWIQRPSWKKVYAETLH